MKRLVVLGIFLIAVACSQEAPPPPAATAPPPPVAAAPPPAPPPPPPTLASFDGHFAGTATLGVSGVSSANVTNPICVDNRPIDMTIHNGYVTLWYHNWKRSKLHYRGRVDDAGKIYVTHLNGDGSRSSMTMQMSDTGATGTMQRGNCSYEISLTRT
jgi:hypothetical protein